MPEKSDRSTESFGSRPESSHARAEGLSVSMVQRGTSLPKVAHVTTSHTSADVRIVQKECRSLASSGVVEVHLFAPGTSTITDDIQHHQMRDKPDKRLHRFALGTPRAYRALRGCHFDAYHFHDPELLPLQLWLALRGKTTIWDAHEDYVSQFTDDGAKAWIPAPLRSVVQHAVALLLNLVNREASAIVAATPNIADKYTNVETVIVGNEARLEEFRGCSPSVESLKVLFLGSPGQSNLFDEVVQAVTRIPGATLVLAGSRPDAEKDRTISLLLGERFEYKGWLGRDKLAKVMSSCSVGMVTYNGSAAHQANLGNKFFEFAAAGLPIVATPTESNRMLIGESDAGVLAEDYTSDAIESAIRRLLVNPQDWSRCSDNGRKWAAMHGSWEESESALIQLYARLLGP